MKKSRNAGRKPVDIKDVDFSDFRFRRKEVTVNGKKLPIAIGDRIHIADGDPIGKTVMGITIHEDSRIQYILEWHDPSTGNFCSEALTLSELKLLVQNAYGPKKSRAGLAAVPAGDDDLEGQESEG